MQCLMVLDPNIFARTQIFRGGPWSLVLLLYPPPSAKVLHKLIIRDPIIRLAWTRYIRSLEPSKCPLRGCQSVITRTILILSQRILESLHMTIRLPEQILDLPDGTLRLSVAFVIVGARHLMDYVLVAAPICEILVFKTRTSVRPYVGRLAI